MSEFNTSSDLLYVLSAICRRFTKKSQKIEKKIGNIYKNADTGELSYTLVMDRYGYSDNMSTKHCDLSDVKLPFLFKCSCCGKYRRKCKHGTICKCSPHYIHNECIKCILFENIESIEMIEKEYFKRDTYDYEQIVNKILMDANKSARTCRYGVNPLYRCLYSELVELHKTVYKKILVDILSV